MDQSLKAMQIIREEVQFIDDITPETVQEAFTAAGPAVMAVKAAQAGEVFPFGTPDTVSESAIRQFAASGGLETMNSPEAFRTMAEISREGVPAQEINEVKINTIRQSVTPTRPAPAAVESMQTVFKPQDSPDYRQAFVENFTAAGGFNGITPEQSIQVMSMVREAAPDPGQITPELVAQVKTPEYAEQYEVRETERQAELSLDDNFEPKPGYQPTEQDFFQYVERNSGPAISDIPYAVSMNCPPQEAFIIASDLNKNIGLSTFTGPELISKINDIHEKKTTVEAAVKTKTPPVSRDNSTSYIVNNPFFSGVSPSVIETWTAKYDPQLLMKLSRDFENYFAGIPNLNIPLDFNLYLEEMTEGK
jgi:hypothetical protein